MSARRYGGPHGYGHVLDPNTHRVTSFRCMLPRLVSDGSAAVVDLSGFAPPVMDQGPTGSCTGHAVSGACSTTCNALGVALPYEPSPEGIYTNARCIDREPLSDGSLPRLRDIGAEPNQVMRGIAEWGVRKLRAPTPDGRRSDCSPTTINDEPMLDELEEDSALELVGHYRIDSRGAQRVADIRRTLESGIAFTFAVFACQKFETWDPARGPLGAPNFQDIAGGWHYLYAIGYRTDAAGKTVLRFRNSWGPGWGIQGDGEGNEAFIASLEDIYVMNVRREAT